MIINSNLGKQKDNIVYQHINHDAPKNGMNENIDM